MSFFFTWFTAGPAELLASFRFSHRTSATTSDVIVIPLRMRELVPRVPCQIQTTGDGANFPDFTSSWKRQRVYSFLGIPDELSRWLGSNEVNVVRNFVSF